MNHDESETDEQSNVVISAESFIQDIADGQLKAILEELIGQCVKSAFKVDRKKSSLTLKMTFEESRMVGDGVMVGVSLKHVLPNLCGSTAGEYNAHTLFFKKEIDDKSVRLVRFDESPPNQQDLFEK